MIDAPNDKPALPDDVVPQRSPRVESRRFGRRIDCTASGAAESPARGRAARKTDRSGAGARPPRGDHAD